jgi:hypothetical protein
MLSGIPALSPGGVYLKGLRHRTVVLDSGETVAVVSGKIINNSEADLSHVLIEGMTFDRAGRTISRTKVDVGSTLADLRINTLTPGMIREIQEDGSAGRAVIKPGEEQGFAIALLDSDLERAAYYSARIYSAAKQG